MIHSRQHEGILFRPCRQGSSPADFESRYEILASLRHPLEKGIERAVKNLEGVSPADVAVEHHVSRGQFIEFPENDVGLPCPKARSSLFEPDIRRKVGKICST